jgi:hypothetical protein
VAPKTRQGTRELFAHHDAFYEPKIIKKRIISVDRARKLFGSTVPIIAPRLVDPQVQGAKRNDSNNIASGTCNDVWHPLIATGRDTVTKKHASTVDRLM